MRVWSLHYVSVLCLFLPVSPFFHNVLWFAPDFFLRVYLSHLDLPISLLPLCSEEKRFLAQPSHIFAFCAISLWNWGMGKGAMLSAQSKGPGFWERLILSMMGPNSRLLRFVLQCRRVFGGIIRSLGFSCLNDRFKSDNFGLSMSEQSLFFIFIFICVTCCIFRQGNTIVRSCSVNWCVYRDAEYPLMHQCLWATTWSKRWSK